MEPVGMNPPLTIPILLQAASNLMVIKQRPKERLQMRGTIHTGSVIAGVQVAK